MPVTTSKDGILAILDEKGDLVAIVRKDMVTRKNVFYSVSEMGMEEIEFLLKTDKVKKIEKQP